MANVYVVAQNFEIYEGDKLDLFARTGKININHLYNVGAQGVILGHSETGDTPEIVNKKILTILDFQNKTGMTVNKLIILVGETLEEYKNSSLEEIAKLVVKKCGIIFKKIPEGFLSNVIIGYEPKWGSSGSGNNDVPPPESELVSICINKIKNFINKKYGSSKKVFFIYGGRVTPERINILNDSNLNGFILGSASSSVERLLEIAKPMVETQPNKTKILVCNFKAYKLANPYEKYISVLRKLPTSFNIYLAPPYTDIREISDLISIF
ncbi:MAG: triose-phosphate isomerase [Candidatus Aenigmarchaeota archaeon]|nr:triose-phosphate isomerase [Candidatus Aenigmarchaeota archaeon]